MWVVVVRHMSELKFKFYNVEYLPSPVVEVVVVTSTKLLHVFAPPPTCGMERKAEIKP